MPKPVDYQLTRERAGPPARRAGVRGHHRQDRRRMASSPGCATSRASSSAAGDYALRSLLNNKDAVAIAIFQAPGSNALAALHRRSARRWRSCKKNFPQGVEYRIVYDPTIFVRESIHEVVKTLLDAMLLVAIIVVVLFLQTWRASIIPLVAVPVSIVGTFAVMLALRVLDQHAVAVRAGAGHRHRGGRRDRGGRERRAQHRGRALAAGTATLQGDGRGERTDHRDRAGALRGVRADRVHQRPHRSVLPAVRADDRHLDRSSRRSTR